MTDWKKTKCGTCVYQRKKPICNSCINYHYHTPMSNADKIRSMSDEELAELFTIWSCEDADYTTLLEIEECKWGTKKEILERNLKWLQSEAE